VVEFTLLALPLCLMTIAATNYSLNVYFDTLLRTGASSAARYASLADTTLVQAQTAFEAYCASRFQQIAANCELRYLFGDRQAAEARVTYQPLSILIYQPGQVIIRARVALEVSK